MQFATIFGFVAAASAAAVTPAKSVLARGDDGEISCDKPSQVESAPAERENFVEGQEYLRGLGTCGADTNDCSRVSCSNNAAMYLCAPEDSDAQVDCGVIADYMDHIFDQCQASGTTYVDAAHGWQENTDGWWVSVGWNDC